MKQMHTEDRREVMRGYTGRIFEREVLGECRFRCQGYLTFQSSVRGVLGNQPYAPHNPPGEVGNFRAAVAAEMRGLGLNPDSLRIYTAVGSPLDHFHRIDGFFSFEGIIVTLDLTVNRHKDMTRAKVLVTGEDAADGYKESAWEIARWFEFAQKTKMKGVLR